MRNCLARTSAIEPRPTSDELAAYYRDKYFASDHGGTPYAHGYTPEELTGTDLGGSVQATDRAKLMAWLSGKPKLANAISFS